MQKELDTIYKKMSEASLLFNRIVDGGRKPSELYLDELLVRMNQQYYVTKEEVDETVKALSEGDVVEYYDGLADILFTATFLIELDKAISSYGVGGDDLSMFEDFGKLGNSVVEILSNKNIDYEILDKVCDQVIENNKLKFTTSLDEISKWQTSFEKTSVEIDGVTYYYLVDENNKVRKYNGFPKVDLSWILDEGIDK